MWGCGPPCYTNCSGFSWWSLQVRARPLEYASANDQVGKGADLFVWSHVGIPGYQLLGYQQKPQDCSDLCCWPKTWPCLSVLEKTKTLSLPRLMVTEERHALSHFEDIYKVPMECPHSKCHICCWHLATFLIPSASAYLRLKTSTSHPFFFLIQAPKSPCCGAVIVIQYNFPMDHLKSVWKDAPAITRSFTVIPLVLHIAGWRWFQQLKLGAWFLL